MRLKVSFVVSRDEMAQKSTDIYFSHVNLLAIGRYADPNQVFGRITTPTCNIVHFI